MSGFNLLHLITKESARGPCGRAVFPQEPPGQRKHGREFCSRGAEERPHPDAVPRHPGAREPRAPSLESSPSIKNDGTYTCVVCGAPLFSSSSKFDSGSGWPSFSDLVKEDSVSLSDDFSYGMHRVETTCSQCGAHLGHLFDDGPNPQGNATASTRPRWHSAHGRAGLILDLGLVRRRRGH
ncbi:methionine-R-sulfoxide reductase B3 [Salarias fasciatus]|uniref:methionine-R-sulfoxide reductase B3 n=1 Tax=Salarias fasciatus TaxID=181472 RepID=UPI001176C63B|nr:methionine-R-sulfoxide reductase B3 [Salarias fasciatus]